VFYDDGIIGFGLFAWLLVLFSRMGLVALKRFAGMMTIRTDRRGRRREVLEEPRAYYMLGFLGAFFAMLVHNTVDVSLRFVSSGIFLWLLIGLIGSLAVNNPMPARSLPPPALTPANALIPASRTWLRRLLQLAVLVTGVILVNVFVGYFRADMHHNRGIFFSKQQQWKDALHHYAEVVRLNPSFVMAHYFMGNVYNDRWEPGDWQRALDKYNAVKRIAPNYVQVHHQVGVVHLKLGEAAMQESQRLQAAGSATEAAAARERGLAEYREAVRNFTLYRKIDPVFLQNFERLGYVFVQLGDLAAAEEVYRAAIEYNQTNPQPYVHVGNICYLRKKLDESEQAYQQALAIDPNNLQALKHLAVVYRDKGMTQQSIQLWQRVRQVSPDDPDVQKVFRTPQ